MEAYKIRLILEYKQLTERIHKLSKLLNNWNELDFSPNCPYELLCKQFNAMSDYQDVLMKRAEIEDVELPKYGGES